MPFYEFHCESCDKDFEQMTTISARDQKAACPHCGSKKTGRKLSVVAVGAGKAAGGAPMGGGSGHVHSGACGCGKPMGSCGLN